MSKRKIGILLVSVVLFGVSFSAFGELTDADIDKIRQVVKAENAIIHADMAAFELRLTQKIQESENRLRSELNAQLNARMNDFTIVFGITSGGFFLLFATVLLVNIFRNRTMVDKKMVLVFVLSVISGLLCLVSTVKAQKSLEGIEIVCSGLKVIDSNGMPNIELSYDTDNTPRITLISPDLSNSVQLFASNNKASVIARSGMVKYKASLSAQERGASVVAGESLGNKSGFLAIHETSEPLIGMIDNAGKEHIISPEIR